MRRPAMLAASVPQPAASAYFEEDAPVFTPELDPAVNQPLRLPKQLSPAILGVLLEDLIEFNGINFRTVPLRTFREKYIGLYFSTLDCPKCQKFLEQLKAFYVVMNHKFECVLVSCDSTEDGYSRHAQTTLWPAYPQGDYRALLLRSHFNILECPQLIVLDPNGMVVTANGVAKIQSDDLGFPWCEKVVETLWGERLQGQIKNVLLDYELPPFEGICMEQYDVVCLLFGELWCPETRELTRRLQFLSNQLRRRDHGSAGYSSPSPCAVYFFHTEDLAKYRGFPDVEMPFPTVRLDDEERRAALQHFLGVDTIPTLVILSPQQGWIVQDGAGWIRRDPTGICFPWRAEGWTVPGSPDEEDNVGGTNIIQELNEEALGEALCNGPVFIAYLNHVHAQRGEAMATLRAAAASYSAKAFDPGMDLEATMTETMTSGKHESFLDSLRQKTAQPWVSAQTSNGDNQQESQSTEKGGRMLWRACQRAVDKHEHGTTSHGSAPWNASSHASSTADNPMRRTSSLSFFYCISEDRAAHMLSRFCCYDVKQLHRHQLWQAVQAKREHESWKMHQDMTQRLASLAQLVQGVSNTPAHRSDSQQQTAQSPVSPSGDSAMGDVAPGGDDQLGDAEDPDGTRGKDAQMKDTPHQPRTRYKEMHELTEQLLGDGLLSHGSAVIIDLAFGEYYLCGCLTDKQTVLRFLDGWHRGELDPFEISLLNQDEAVKDDDQEVSRQLAGIPQQVPTLFQDMLPNVMPTIVIWMPTRQHSQGVVPAAALYRALLHFAYRRSPREDDSVSWSIPGTRLDHDDTDSFTANKGGIEKLAPWIEKFWIFGLLDEEEAAHETGQGDWGAPGMDFLAELHTYIDRLVKRVDFEKRRTNPGQDAAWAKDAAVNPEMLISQTDLFDDALKSLRESRSGGAAHEFDVLGNYNLCLRTARTRQEIYAMMLDELSYHVLVQYPPPPLFVLLVGDLPSADVLPWPTTLRRIHLQVVGNVPDFSQYREVSPCMHAMDWERWVRNSLDDHIAMNVSRHISVPFQ